MWGEGLVARIKNTSAVVNDASRIGESKQLDIVTYFNRTIYALYQVYHLTPGPMAMGNMAGAPIWWRGYCQYNFGVQSNNFQGPNQQPILQTRLSDTRRNKQQEKQAQWWTYYYKSGQRGNPTKTDSSYQNQNIPLTAATIGFNQQGYTADALQ